MNTNQNLGLFGGKKNEINSHAEFISASSTQAVLPWKQQRQALKTLKQVQGDLMITTTSGFTLIELLVVVLIIGILAAVAVPQYNKAVRKARLSEVTTTFNSISKGIDMWLLENGGLGNAVFSGINKTASLDIVPTCTTEDGTYCYTKLGRWKYECVNSFVKFCNIYLYTSYNADTTTGNKWLDSSTLQWYKYPNGEWGLIVNNLPNSVKKDVCIWWKDMYGDKRVIDGYGAVSTDCD